MESAREARRRKILERGSDRLAFITGQTQSINPTTPPPSEPPKDESTLQKHEPISKIITSAPELAGISASLSTEGEVQPKHESSSAITTSVPEATSLAALMSSQDKSELQKHESRSRMGTSTMGMASGAAILSSKDEPKHVPSSKITPNSPNMSSFAATFSAEDVPDLPKHGPNSASISAMEVARGAELFNEQEKRVEPTITASAIHGSFRPVHPVAQASPGDMTDAPRGLVPTKTYLNFSAKRISSCISMSENIRLLCVTMVAVLVVLAYRGYGVGGQIITSIISFRPIYLVLLTDATIVLWLLMTKQEPERRQEARNVDGDVFDLANILEIGLLLQKAMKAAFMDCSLCALIMIIGIPFGSKGVV